jgi:hypothetical protein
VTREIAFRSRRRGAIIDGMAALTLTHPTAITAHAWRRRPAMRLSICRAGAIDTPQWVWVRCTEPRACGHRVAMASAPPIIRWGSDDWPAMLRRHARCSHCGRRGAATTMPSWGGMGIGWSELPVEYLAEAF